MKKTTIALMALTLSLATTACDDAKLLSEQMVQVTFNQGRDGDQSFAAVAIANNDPAFYDPSGGCPEAKSIDATPTPTRIQLGGGDFDIVGGTQCENISAVFDLDESDLEPAQDVSVSIEKNGIISEVVITELITQRTLSIAQGQDVTPGSTATFLYDGPDEELAVVVASIDIVDAPNTSTIRELNPVVDGRNVNVEIPADLDAGDYVFSMVVESKPQVATCENFLGCVTMASVYAEARFTHAPQD